MNVDAESGLVTWLPTPRSPAVANLVLLAYDNHGARATQEFNIDVTGGNRFPILNPIPSQFVGLEGEPLSIKIAATDPDGDSLVFWADHLRPGVVVC